MAGKSFSETWIKELEGPLPGADAHMQMAVSNRQIFPEVKDPEEAAVLILLYPMDESTGIVFMKRNDYDGPHSGQVSFPGGRWEEGDSSLEETALRETREELGVKEEIEVLGRLTEVEIQVSNFRVTPYVAFTPKQPEFRPDSSEVQYVIESTLDHLLEPSCRSNETWNLHGQDVGVPFFKVGKEKIWGATAMMLAEFLQLAARLPGPRR